MILALESSCDETAVAVFDPAHGLAGEWVHSQIALHEKHGGVVPDLATREALRELFAVARVHACFAMSVETLESLMNVFSTMGISPRSKVTMLVPHVRVAKAAHACGFDRIEEVPMADSTLVARLAALKSRLLAPIASSSTS